MSVSSINSKIGVLLVNLGTPDDPSRGSVYRYLKQFLMDPRVIDIPYLPRTILVNGIIAPFRSGSSAKIYKKLWTENGSPLKYYGYKLKEGVQEIMGDDFIVELGMRYQQPSIESAINNLKKALVKKIIVLPLFPHYASASTGSVHEEVMRIMGKTQGIPDMVFINSYPTYEPLIDVFVENARKFDLSQYDHFLFSYHGLPQRQLRKVDTCNHCLKVENCCQTISSKNQFCYSAQCHQTTFAIAEKLNIPKEKYTVCFQSRLGRDPWVQPYTTDVLEKRSELGDKKLLVFSPAFVADCLETVIEIGEEYNEEFMEMGGEVLDFVPSLNDNPKWIKGVADLVLSYN